MQQSLPVGGAAYPGAANPAFSLRAANAALAQKAET